MRILTTAQMRDVDRRAMEAAGLSAMDLMAIAAGQVVRAVEAWTDSEVSGSIGVVCGPGMNGGDGLLAARAWHDAGVPVAVWLVAAPAALREPTREVWDRAVRAGVPCRVVETAADVTEMQEALPACALIIDALLGVGARVPVTGRIAEAVDAINTSGVSVVSVDVPTGVDVDSATVPGIAVEADMTVAIGALKTCHVVAPASIQCGDVVVADLGVDDAILDGCEGPDLRLLSREAVARWLPQRAVDAHKGAAGRVLIIAGARGTTGAAWLCAMGALRAGAGLVTVATTSEAQPVVAALGAEYMTVVLPTGPNGGLDPSGVPTVLARATDVIIVGPGVGLAPETHAFVRALCASADVPVVIDADALTVCAGDAGGLGATAERVRVVTPHPGEMARLTGRTVDEVQSDRMGTARRYAAATGAVVVLKGHRTLVVSPDGTTAVNPTGNPGMATGGTGDVLAGMVGGLIAQLGDAARASQLAVYLHGLAGDLAAAQRSEWSLVAGDLLQALGPAFLDVARAGARGADPVDRGADLAGLEVVE